MWFVIRYRLPPQKYTNPFGAQKRETLIFDSKTMILTELRIATAHALRKKEASLLLRSFLSLKASLRAKREADDKFILYDRQRD